MNADLDPHDAQGRKLKRGNLVVIYNDEAEYAKNGIVYVYVREADVRWIPAAHIGAVDNSRFLMHARQCLAEGCLSLTSLETMQDICRPPMSRSTRLRHPTMFVQI